MDHKTEYILTADGELYHAWLKKGAQADKHKYVARVENGDGYRYFYTWNEYSSYLKSKASERINSALKKGAEKAEKKALKTANTIAANIDKYVDKAKTVINNVYDDPDNKYDVTRASYTKKLNEIKNTKEWKDIVDRNDKEYVKKNSDGTTTYLIDDYVVDKKHPVLDAISDITAGRKVSTHEITKETVVAGLKDYARFAFELGMIGTSFATNGLTKKFKFSQGSYDDEIQNLMDTVDVGAQYVNNVVESTKTVQRTVERAGGSPTVNSVDIEKLASEIHFSNETTPNINEDTVVEAAKVLMESETIANALGTNEYYKQAERALSNLSDEEIMIINLLMQEMRRGEV